MTNVVDSFSYTGCHTVRLPLICSYIKTISPSWWLCLFSSPVCLTRYWYCREKLVGDQAVSIFSFAPRWKRRTEFCVVISMRTGSSVSCSEKRRQTAFQKIPSKKNFEIDVPKIFNSFTPRVKPWLNKCGCTFWVCGCRKPNVWPFKWKLFRSAFKLWSLFLTILQNEILSFEFRTLGSERVKLCKYRWPPLRPIWITFPRNKRSVGRNLLITEKKFTRSPRLRLFLSFHCGLACDFFPRCIQLTQYFTTRKARKKLDSPFCPLRCCANLPQCENRDLFLQRLQTSWRTDQQNGRYRCSPPTANLRCLLLCTCCRSHTLSVCHRCKLSRLRVIHRRLLWSRWMLFPYKLKQKRACKYHALYPLS